MSIAMIVVILCLLILAAWFTKTNMPAPWSVPVLVVIVLVFVGFVISLAFPGLLSQRVR